VNKEVAHNTLSFIIIIIIIIIIFTI